MSEAAPTKNSGGMKLSGIFTIVGVVLALGLYAAFAGGSDQARPDRASTETSASAGTSDGRSDVSLTSRVEHVEVSAGEEFIIQFPAKSEDWNVIDRREGWTLCYGRNRDGLDIEFRTSNNGNWNSAWPSAGQTVFGRRHRSQTEEERELDANWDMSPTCSTPVPS